MDYERAHSDLMVQRLDLGMADHLMLCTSV
jgi:hypothetical protein